jgi:hypothetical protein
MQDEDITIGDEGTFAKIESNMFEINIVDT